MTIEKDRPSMADGLVPEDGAQGVVHGKTSGATGRRTGMWSGRMKGVCVGVLGVIALGLALKWAYPFLSAHLDRFGGANKSDASIRVEDYAPMKPFFIPMPSGRDSVAARVSLRVKWDPLTGARFNRDAVLIRQRIYLYLKAFEQWSEDMEANRQVLEQGIARILREALGVKDLDVLVEDIHYVRVEALAFPESADARSRDDRTSNTKGV